MATADSHDPTLRRPDAAGDTRPTLPAAPPPSPVAGEARFGKFRRTQRLGAGGMGEVWKAWDEELRRWVALKFLKGGDDEEIARFRREAQLAGTLSHPHIAAIYEVGADQGRQFIAMQFVDGQTLKTLTRRDRRLLVTLTRDAARAVQFAHEQGIIHRDLKPENLMVTARPPHLYVMDFGLARSVEGDQSVPGSVVGTPAYMSPEQARGEHVDPRTDVYSLGATLYELLTDRRVVAGDNMYDILKRVQEDDPKPLRAIDWKIDPDLETIVLKSLEKEADQRYATAAALADDLDAWLSGEPIAARPTSVTYRLRKRLARRKVAVGLSSALMVAAVTAGVLWMRSSADRDAARDAQGRVEQESLYRPIERDLDVLRMNFYRPNFRLTDADVDAYEALIQKLEAQMTRTGESARGRWLVGRCREVTADYVAAEKAYDRAIALDALHAPSLLARGRLGIERAQHLGSSARGDLELRRAATEQASRAAELVRRGAKAAGTRTMELDLAEAYLNVVDAAKPTPFDAGPMMTKWAREPHVEEFLLVEAMSGRTPRAAAVAAILVKVPSDFRLWFWRGAWAGNIDKEADFLSKSLEINPRFVPALVNRGAMRLFQGDLAGAMVDFDLAVRVEPTSAWAWSNRGLARLRARDYEASIADSTKAIELQPRLTEAIFNRGCAHLRMGDRKAAIRDFDRAIALDPTRADHFVNRAGVRMDLGDLDGALDDLKHALDLNPREELALVLSGGIASRRGNVEEALRWYGKAIEVNPRRVDALTNRAELRRRNGDLDGALVDARAAVLADPGSVAAQTALGEVLVDRKEFKSAVGVYDAALKLERSAPLLSKRGEAREKAGDARGALDDYNAALAADPQCVDALVSRGALKSNGGDVDGGIADFNAALKIDPKSASAYRNRGITHERKNNFDAAMRDFNEALTLDPIFAEGYYSRAVLHSMLKQHARAVMDFTEALRLRPRYLEAHVYRGFSLLALNDPKALVDFEAAVKIDPRCADGWVGRGQVHERLGDIKTAIADYEESLKVAPPDWPYRAQIQSFLKDLKK